MNLNKIIQDLRGEQERLAAANRMPGTPGGWPGQATRATTDVDGQSQGSQLSAPYAERRAAFGSLGGLPVAGQTPWPARAKAATARVLDELI
ncbi:MAG TPA: hypothetical protein VK302_11285 [Terriglobales bacterium]|nr:hypothetical protein [Terriglobales bacterium]